MHLSSDSGQSIQLVLSFKTILMFSDSNIGRCSYVGLSDITHIRTVVSPSDFEVRQLEGDFRMLNSENQTVGFQLICEEKTFVLRVTTILSILIEFTDKIEHISDGK
uniref:Uncharacterized protein n=1 Tax=Cacopsylla melanoneura TaxID=428564 RepID=A0A8D9E0S9_9HEMI